MSATLWGGADSTPATWCCKDGVSKLKSLLKSAG
jgi:hypothetical protein